MCKRYHINNVLICKSFLVTKPNHYFSFPFGRKRQCKSLDIYDSVKNTMQTHKHDVHKYKKVYKYLINEIEYLGSKVQIVRVLVNVIPLIVLLIVNNFVFFLHIYVFIQSSTGTHDICHA